MQKLARMLLVFAGAVVCYPTVAAQHPSNTEALPESAEERRSREFLRDLRERTTYLLRSIVYRTSDILVAFRVARIDQDGSVIIAWRILRSFNTPNLHSR